MRRALLLLLILPVFAACAEDKNGSTVDNEQGDPGHIVIQYQGRPLDCITWLGSHQEVGLSCDFVKYHGKVTP